MFRLLTVTTQQGKYYKTYRSPLAHHIVVYSLHNRPLGYKRVYLPLYEVADTPFDIHGDGIIPYKSVIRTKTRPQADLVSSNCLLSR